MTQKDEQDYKVIEVLTLFYIEDSVCGGHFYVSFTFRQRPSLLYRFFQHFCPACLLA